MAVYLYKAKKGSEETVVGKINAQSQEEAVDLIHDLGFLPVTVELDSNEKKDIESSKSRNVRTSEIYLFSRQFANLLKSGVSVLRALTILEQQTQSSYFKRVIAHMTISVKNGKSLSESLSAYPKIFSSLYVTMVRAGEESSNLQQMLLNVSEYQKREEELVRKVKTALAYPMLMGVLGVATVYFILTYVLPKMSSLFDSLADQLPLPTVILLNVSKFLSIYWLWLAGGLVCAVTLFRQWKKTEKGKKALSHYILHLPYFGQIILKTELSRFCRSLVLLSKSGVSIVRSLEISIPILSNSIIKDHLKFCMEDLIAGGSFGQSIKISKEIPSMMGHLISIGEESGNLNDVLEELADTYEQETNEQIKMLTTLLEPIMILIIGLVIGLIVFAILLPIFSIDVLAQ